jgi:hypothetical protein
VSRFFDRSIHQHGLISNEIPLRRYFMLAGGALLALLFAADALIPRQPAMKSCNSGPHLPRIRIHSELKGPEAVVIDTNRPIIVPTPTTQDDTGKAVASPKPQVAENIAQLVSPSLKHLDAKEQSKVGPGPQPRSYGGKARTKRLPMSYAQRREVGPSDGTWTFYQQDASFRESFAQLVPRQPRQRSTRGEVAWTRTEHARRLQFGWFDTGW